MQLFLCVENEGSVIGDRLVQWLAGEEQEFCVRSCGLDQDVFLTVLIWLEIDCMRCILGRDTLDLNTTLIDNYHRVPLGRDLMSVSLVHLRELEVDEVSGSAAFDWTNDPKD